MSQIWVPGACAVAIRCKDGVVLGNDTRSTWGYTVNDKNVTKIFPLTKDKRIAFSCYGLVGDFQALARIMQAQANIYELREGYKISVQAMAKMVANYLYQRKMAPLYANVIVAGIDEKGPRVFTMDAIGSLMEDDYGVAGSSGTFAIGMLEAEWKPMTTKKGVELVKKVISNAIKRDAMAGNAMDVMAITMKGIETKRTSFSDLGE
ncbi:MAG: proteasome subunit beta [Promethearchaeota archaeon]